MRQGPAGEGAGGPGWYVESWAHCDYSELPRSFTDSIGLQIWTDAEGKAAATATSQLPVDAVGTGFERDRDRLWLSADQQKAFVGTADDLEVWPRMARPFGCA